MGESLSAEQERAAIIAYTGLWQLLDLDPDGESEILAAARMELRATLDANDVVPGDARRPARLDPAPAPRSVTLR